MGWISCISVCFSLYNVFVSKLFCFMFCFMFFSACFLFVLCVRLVYWSFCIYNRTHTYRNIRKQQTTRRKHQTTTEQQKYIISQPEPERYLFAVGSWAGYPVFLLFCFSRSFSVYSCWFSPSLFKLLHLQSKNTYNNIKQQQTQLCYYTQKSFTMERNPLL